MNLNKEEQTAIRRLKAVAKIWPKSLWLFSASGTLCVMQKDENGNIGITDNGAMDSDYIVDYIRNIPNDGGDW